MFCARIFIHNKKMVVAQKKPGKLWMSLQCSVQQGK